MSRAELDFAVHFARTAGAYMRVERTNVITSHKLDRTVVTDIDECINRDFIETVKERFGRNISVVGEETSARTQGSTVWVIDPIDGTGEYITSLANNKRTSCIGIAMLKNGELRLSVVYNPFRNELFVAARHLGGTFLNNRRLRLDGTKMGTQELTTGTPYDYCHWQGCLVDARFFKKVLGTPPLNSYSAINQACDVARGRSAFAVFPGDTIHDIAPSALQVELAGGVVTDVHGRSLQWHNLHGVVYAANPRVHASVIQHLNNRV